jgi:hypothetical protein
MTTMTPIRVNADDYPDTRDSDEHMEYLVLGLASATQWPTGFGEATPSDDPMGEHPARLAWEAVCDEAAAEIAPQVADMLTAAVRRRLPWTWEPR